MEPIRVLQVVTFMNRGGLESMLMNYYRNIDRSKIQFDFLEHREGKHDFTDEILSLGGKIYTVPSVNPFNTNGYLNALDNFFQQHKEYNIIHSHLDCMSSYPLKYAKKHDFPVRLAHSHNTNQEKNLKYLLKMHSRLQIPKYASNLFACSEEAGKWMYGQKEFRILNNAIDAKKFIYDSEKAAQVKKSLEIEDKFVLGHIGRFNAQKNHDFLIDIFEKVYQQEHNSVLLLIGVGELEEEIRKKVETLNLTSVVKFLGLRDDIPDLLQGMDAFIFPSLFEGLPVTLVEAQANGLPCVISDTITNEVEITDNIEYLGLAKKPDEWASHILKYKGKNNREEMYDVICEKGFDIISNVDWLENFYMSCIEGGQHA